jgi:hypothetical protein
MVGLRRDAGRQAGWISAAARRYTVMLVNPGASLSVIARRAGCNRPHRALMPFIVRHNVTDDDD